MLPSSHSRRYYTVGGTWTLFVLIEGQVMDPFSHQAHKKESGCASEYEVQWILLHVDSHCHPCSTKYYCKICTECLVAAWVTVVNSGFEHTESSPVSLRLVPRVWERILLRTAIFSESDKSVCFDIIVLRQVFIKTGPLSCRCYIHGIVFVRSNIFNKSRNRW